MRISNRSGALALLNLIVFMSCKTACPPPLPTNNTTIARWSCPTIVRGRLGTNKDVRASTQANGALSILFDSAKIDLQSAAAPYADTWSAVLDFELETNIQQVTDVQCQIRGDVMKSSGTYVGATVTLGGTGATLEFGEGAADVPINRDVSVVLMPRQQKFGVTVTLSASRTSSEGVAMVAIHSVDCAARLPR